MSPELRDLLHDAAPASPGLPSAKETWAIGRRRRRRRTAAAVLASTLALAGLVAVSQQILDQPSPPEVVDSPPTTGAPTGAPRTERPTAPPASSGSSLQQAAVASTLALPGGTGTAGGMTLERYLPDGTAVVGVDDGVAYPERLWGLPDGTVAWLGDPGVLVLDPGASEPRVLLPSSVSDPGRRLGLVGTGLHEGQPVLLVTESQAGEPGDDDGGVLLAVAPDGTSTQVPHGEVSREFAVTRAATRAGWTVMHTHAAGLETVTLTAPNGTTTDVAAGDYAALGEWTLAEYDVESGIALVSLVESRRIEIRSVLDPMGEPIQAINLPVDGSVDAIAGGLAKQLVVAGEWAHVTLLPDFEQALQVNLYSGQASIHDAPGLLALHADLQPRAPDAGPLADCAAEGRGQTADAQAYVWFPCPGAATFEEGDDPARFHGIQKVALVTDPRASSGGIDQRVTAMLETIFAGPDPQQEAMGYVGIIDPDMDALAGVAYADGLVTVDLTEDGGLAASIGTSTRAHFQTTVEAAIFGGFVDVERVRITVEGDCERWALMGESTGCATTTRDDVTTTG